MINIYIPEIDNIYFSKTREYFQEVISSYANGNYRSAIVMLYSIAICDILFKLQELNDMYNDTVANEILKNIEKCRNEHDNKSKSRWEKELVDEVYKKTNLLDLESYTNLNHLYDHRNFSAHPALNDNYELISPSKETTIAHIRNTLYGILIKPPIFIKNIINLLTEDLKTKRDIYVDEDDKLQAYLNNKYFSKMTSPMKVKLFTTLWKFCFCMPDDEQCKSNLRINRKALQILTNDINSLLPSIMKKEPEKYAVSMDETCLFNLIMYLSHLPMVYKNLDIDVKLHIDSIIEKRDDAKAMAWFKSENLKSHLHYLKEIPDISYNHNILRYMKNYYRNNGEINELYEYFIWYYGCSSLYDYADDRFDKIIRPNLEEFSLVQLEEIIKVSDGNSQIYGRRRAYSANTKIAKEIIKKTNENFDFTAFTNFDFDKSILNEIEF